jgi:dihydroorotate dehydrogenase
MKPIYDVKKTYGDNFDNPPKYEYFELSDSEKNMPVGVPAGPLLGSGHVIAAIDAGANVVVYKTVRTRRCESLPFPNCVGLKAGAVVVPFGEAIAGRNRQNDRLRTNSFGMPSTDPSAWMPDVAIAARYAKQRGRRMIVSCVGTPDENASGQKAALSDDYAKCAALAVRAGAEAIELNFSCPNVKKELGAIYLSPELVSDIIGRTKRLAGAGIPIYIKVGHFPNIEIMEKVVRAAVDEGAAGIVGINTISMSVIKPRSKTAGNPNGIPALPGRPNAVSGVCGSGIARLAEEWLKNIVDMREKLKMDFEIGSCGGIVRAEEFSGRLDKGADMAFSASGFMSDPKLFHRFHKIARSGGR